MQVRANTGLVYDALEIVHSNITVSSLKKENRTFVLSSNCKLVQVHNITFQI